MDTKLKGKTVVITGASRNMGSLAAVAFAREGANLAICTSAKMTQLNEVAAECRAHGVRVVSEQCDVADPASVNRFIGKVVGELGTVHVVLNNAVYRVDTAPFLEVPDEDWEKSFRVNLGGPRNVCKAVLPLMIKQRWGKIINISSQTGVIALDDHSAYASSKGGLNALTKSLCVEWAKHNIQVNAICPTVILTPMGRKIWGPTEKSGPMLKATPLGRFGEPVEIADMALYLASPASELVNGSILMIEGGYTSL